MKWRNPSQTLPEQGQIVAILTSHKGRRTSCQVIFGVTSWTPNKLICSVDNMDELGYGCIMWDLWRHENIDTYNDLALAWMPIDEFIFPSYYKFGEDL